MKCEKCSKDKNKGAYYKFYFGTLLNTTVKDQVIRQRFSINGDKKSWLCDSCVDKESLKYYFGFIILIIVALTVIIYGEGKNNSGIQIIATIIAVFFGLKIYERFKEGIGAYLAIKINKPQLDKDGNMKFFTSRAYSKLRSPIQLKDKEVIYQPGDVKEQ